MTKKNSLNTTIGNVAIFTSWIILICAIIFSLIIWKKTNNLIFIISGFIGTLGVLFNIYLLSREKSKKRMLIM